MQRIGHHVERMTTLTIRKIDPAVKERLRVRAARRGHSMEEEVRRILKDACGSTDQPETLADVAERLFGEGNGVDLELPTRTMPRPPPKFD